jgi:copper chaperone CopZ
MKVSSWAIPILLIAVTAVSLAGARLLAFPSVTVEYRLPPPGSSSSVAVFLVEGVRCVDTAEQAASALAETDGVFRLVAFASRSRVDVTYDSEVCSPETIRSALEGPILDESTGSFMFGQFRVVEIDGRAVGP